MNIFITNEDPVLAARDLCDKHVRSKMQIEGAIMLAHAFPQEVLDHPSTPKTKSGRSRRSGKGYFKHQCSIWARESKENFKWLVDHTLEQFSERMFRWPSSAEHFTKDFIVWCSKNLHNTTIEKDSLTPFAVAIGSDCNCRKVISNFDDLDTVEKYRSYIIYDKDFAVWTKRESPTWYRTAPLSDRLLYDSSLHQLEHQAA
jgi:hypothetical protein